MAGPPRVARLPFSFGQSVWHKEYPNLRFSVLSQELDASGCWTISVTEKGGGFWQYKASESRYAREADEQRDMAAWMGCSVERMNAHHDRLHAWLAERTGHPSYSLMQARGEPLTAAQQIMAGVEEDAVLYLQRFLCALERHTVACEQVEDANVCEDQAGDKAPD